MIKKQLLALIKDIRFWILLFFVLHLSTITLPPLEPNSTWRQTDGLMIARNFFEHNANILYPTTDVTGEKAGIVGCEFPILNYLISILSFVFGYQHWYGRFINLIASSFGIFFFFKLIKNYFGQPAAFNSAVIVLSSIWFTYNRTNIPDTFALSLCIISLYYAVQYLEKEKVYHLLIFFILGLVGCLSKITAATILTVLAVPYFLTQSTWRAKGSLLLLSSVILTSVCVWYFYWVPYLNEISGGVDGHFFMGMPIRHGIHLLLSNLPLTLKRFYDTPFKFVGFFVFLIGLYFVIKRKKWLPLALFLIPFTAYLVMLPKLAIGWHIDAYYVIMFIPPMAFIMGWGLTQFDRKIITVIALLGIGVEGVANQIHVLEIRYPFNTLENLETVVDKVTSRTDLIGINGLSYGDPTPMYMAHRKGWVTNTESFSNSEFLESIRKKGCKYIVMVKKIYGEVPLNLATVYDSDDYRIYDLNTGLH
jgi:hypothetical protein